MFVQSSLFSDTVYKIVKSIYVNLQQVKTEWGVSREGGRERKRATDKQSERQRVGHKWIWQGLEMAVSEKGQANQKNQKAVNHLGWISNSSISLLPQHLLS
jgi:hypothetical protein